MMRVGLRPCDPQKSTFVLGGLFVNDTLLEAMTVSFLMVFKGGRMPAEFFPGLSPMRADGG